MNIIKKISNKILEIDNPSRYFPCEYKIGKKTYSQDMVKGAICFPDLYEIGMSNNSIKIIYNQLNKLPYFYCDRVFSVALDFEKLLRDNDVPLFTIEQQFQLNNLDFLGFSLGTELAATNILQVLDLGKIPLHAKDRGDKDPIVIIGGAAATNPLPFSDFIDFCYIGESESHLEEIASVLKQYKTRKDRLTHLKEIDCLWFAGNKLAVRAVDSTFGQDYENKYLYDYYAVPSFEVAQDHGTAEIMRGCPNGCRFCHAGQYYKPYRQRNLDKIAQIVEQNVHGFGYREVTLSSLSSGDYPSLDVLINHLNSKYAKQRVSFSLPSLKVSTFSLDILDKISEVRKSGLTFAIETPLLNNQRSLNKEVYVQTVIDIINIAKSRGWKLAKFYFMVGLPFVDLQTEKQNIADFLLKIRTATKINMNINIGTFIPKAHTPFQWARQLTLEQSDTHLKDIKHSLMASIPGIKVSYHEPSISFLEGVISRGDSKLCKVIEKAYMSGCRLDAWDEYFCFDKWQQAFEETSYDYTKNQFDFDEELPWDSVSLGISKQFLLEEYNKAKNETLTSACSELCDHKCGSCNKNVHVKKAQNLSFTDEEPKQDIEQINNYNQVIIKYKKDKNAIYNSHIAVMRQFEMAFLRSKLSINFTEGFNPKPRLEFANPLSMGVYGDNELLLCELPDSQINDLLISKLNSVLADGFTVTGYTKIKIPESGKKISLASHFKGSMFEFSNISDKRIEQSIQNNQNDCFSITKENGSYYVYVNGEKNIFKTLFNTEEMNKFYIAENCKITRKYIDLSDITTC